MIQVICNASGSEFDLLQKKTNFDKEMNESKLFILSQGCAAAGAGAGAGAGAAANI